MGKGLYGLTKPNGSPVKILANARDLKVATTDGYASPPASPSKQQGSPAKSMSKDGATVDLTHASPTSSASERLRCVCRRVRCGACNRWCVGIASSLRCRSHEQHRAMSAGRDRDTLPAAERRTNWSQTKGDSSVGDRGQRGSATVTLTSMDLSVASRF